MIKTIEPQLFEMELNGPGEPLLVAFLKRNERFAEQAETMEQICRTHRRQVRCYLFDADYLDTAMERFSVKGTPTFLLFKQGQEVNRLIGESDKATLDEFIQTAIPS